MLFSPLKQVGIDPITDFEAFPEFPVCIHDWSMTGPERGTFTVVWNGTQNQIIF